MANATKSRKSKVQPVKLVEDIAYTSTAARVDREKGVIYGVKVIGTQSEHGRTYPIETLRKALPLYEGVLVNVDHNQTQNFQQADKRLGRLVNARLEADGIYADLEYLKSHPLAERLCEAAERMPGAFGLSQNAAGDKDYSTGTCVITNIKEVNSVDLVADPATTNGLFEAKTVKTTYRKILESKMPKLSDARKAWAKLLESDEMATAMDAPVEVDSGEPSLEDAITAAVVAIMADESLDSAAKAKKITALLKTHENITAQPEPEAPVAEAEGEDKKAEDDKATESAAVKSANEAWALLESLGFSKAKVKALQAVEGDERKELLEAFKKPEVKPQSRTTPITADVSNRENWLKSLRN